MVIFHTTLLYAAYEWYHALPTSPITGIIQVGSGIQSFFFGLSDFRNRGLLKPFGGGEKFGYQETEVVFFEFFRQ
jgi:hypothetical protein